MRWLRTFARAAIRGRCPHCGRGAMFRGYGLRSYYVMLERCPVCATRFETSDGAWLGAVAIGYAFGALFGIVAAVVEIVWRPLTHAGLDPTWTIAIAALPVTVACYRPAKGLWFGLLYLYGFMDTPTPAEAPSPDAR